VGRGCSKGRREAWLLVKLSRLMRVALKVIVMSVPIPQAEDRASHIGRHGHSTHQGHG